MVVLPCTQAKTKGNINKAAKVDAKRPPITARPKGEVWSPPLAPEEVDETTSPEAEEVTVVAVEATLVERVRVTEHFLAIEYVPVRVPDRRSRPRLPHAELMA